MSIPEKNRDTLRQAISALAQKSAPENNWEGIAERLDELHQFDQISAAARQLPKLTAPVASWQHIDQQLNAPSAPVRRLWGRPWPAAAAAITMVLIAAWFLWPQESTSSVKVAVRSETLNASLLNADWGTDEAAFTEVTALYRKHQKTFPSPTGRDWLAELKELDAAHSELKKAINTFGRDAILLNQLADIERERSAILKQMAQQI